MKIHEIEKPMIEGCIVSINDRAVEGHTISRTIKNYSNVHVTLCPNALLNNVKTT